MKESEMVERIAQMGEMDSTYNGPSDCVKEKDY